MVKLLSTCIEFPDLTLAKIEPELLVVALTAKLLAWKSIVLLNMTATSITKQY